MKNKLISVLFIFMFILSFAVFVSAANSDGLLQIWRNASTGANVSYVDNNGNWFSSGNFNLSGIYYGNGAGLTNLNVSALDLSGYVPYTGSSKNVVLGNYNFSVGTSKLFVNYNTGNVGIGTTNPYLPLQVGNISGTLGTNFKIAGDTAIGAVDPGTRKALYLYASNGIYKLDAYDYGTGSALTFKIGGNGGDVLFPGTGVWENSGNVGIGTTAPTQKLTVGDTGATSNVLNEILLVGRRVSDGTFASLNLSNSADTGESQFSIIARRESNNNGVSADFNINDNTAAGVPLTAMTLLYNGNVGIGTTAPGGALDITRDNGATGNQLYIRGGSSVNDRTGIRFMNTAGNELGLIQAVFDDATSVKASLRFSVRAKTDALVIDNAGNVGIGTVSPQDTLDVNGAIRFGSGSFVSGQARAYVNSVNGLSIVGEAGTLYDISIAEAGGQLLVANPVGTNDVLLAPLSTGNVGIGTTAPGRNLEIDGTLPIIRIADTDATNITETSAYLEFGKNSGSWARYAYLGFGSATNNDFYIDTESGAGNVVIQTAGGNVGIGTTAPGYRLELPGNNAATEGLAITDSADSYNARVKVFDNGGGGGAIQLFDSSETATILLQANGDAYFNNGNVGIGTTSPTGSLEIYRTSGGVNSFVINTSFSGGNAFAINPFITGINNGGFEIRDVTNSVDRIVIAPTTGNVGIGTTSPNSKLEVAGTFNATSSGGTLQVDSSGNVKIGL